MDNITRIASFLAQGLKPAQVATIVGVTPGYIAQLMKEAKESPNESRFALALAEATPKEQENLSEDKILTNKYLSAEHKILQAIEDQIAFAELPALTRALEVVSNRQEKRASRLAQPANSGVTVQNIIQLSLPAHAIPEHVINSQKEVVAIDSRNLAPLSSDGVKNLFSQISQQKALAQPTAGTEF